MFRNAVITLILLASFTLVIPTRASTIDQILTKVNNEDSRQIDCIANAIYYEARGEHSEGMRAVGHVIMNRSHNSKFASTACGIVETPGQFTYNHKQKITDKKAYSIANHIAEGIYFGNDDDITKGAIAFHVNYVNPHWTHMIRTATIGHQIFYKFA